VTRLLYPLYARGTEVLGATARGWSAEEMPYLAAGLYHLIFGYFANARLLEAVVQQDLTSAAAVARQRRFVRAAVGLLLDAAAGYPRIVRSRRAPSRR
jgi:hypothetical protein